MADYKLTENELILRTVDGVLFMPMPHVPEYPAYWEWLQAGGVPDPAPVTSVLPQNLMAQFTADDAVKIQAAVGANPQFWLLWSAMQAQKDPMEIGNARFLAGWSALVAVLGADRMAAIAGVLGVKVA